MRINLVRFVKALELFLKLAVLPFLGVMVYAAYMIREGWLCSTINVPGCSIVSVNFIFLVIMICIPIAVLWNISKHVGRWVDSPRVRSDQQIVQDFSTFILEKAPDAMTTFYDVEVLPHNKHRIREALLNCLTVAYSLKDADTIKAIESTLLLTLPHFQSGIGRSPIFTGNEMNCVTDNDNLFAQWHLKDAKAHPDYLDLNFQIEKNHHTKLISDIREANVIG